MNVVCSKKLLIAWMLIVLLIYFWIFKEYPTKQVYQKRSSKVDVKTSSLREIQSVIWKQIESLQEHGDCEKKKILYCDTHINFAGLGSMLHRYGVCIQVAFALGRLFLIQQKEYQHFGGLSRWLLPDSKRCGYLKTKVFPSKKICYFDRASCYKSAFEIDQSYKVLYFTPRPIFPTARRVPGTIPTTLKTALDNLNVTDPKMWFAAQFLGYLLLRPNEYFLKRYRKFLHQSHVKYPFVSMHVRHGDKLLREAKYIKEEKFVQAAKDFFSEHPEIKQKQIYIASDDRNISEVIKKLVPPSYKISMLPMRYRLKTFHKYKNNSGFPRQVIESMLIDIYFLLYSNYTICTYTSNIGRLVGLLKLTVYPYHVQGTMKPVDDESIFGYKWYGSYYQTKMRQSYVSVNRNKKKKSDSGLDLLQYKRDKRFVTTSFVDKKLKTKKKKGVLSRKEKELMKKMKKKNRPYMDVIYAEDCDTRKKGFIYKKDMADWPGNPSYYFYPE